VSKAKGLGSDRFTKLRLHLANIYQLFIKELRSIRHDPIVLAVMAYSFTIAVYAVATGASTEATNLSVGIVDEDHSDLSRRIADGLTPPTFKPPVQISASDIDPAMNSQRFIFVIEIPPKFEQDVLAGRRPTIQIGSMPRQLPRPSMGRPTSRTSLSTMSLTSSRDVKDWSVCR